MKARKGFTLVELLVVVLVLAILAGVMVPRIIDFQKNAVKQSCKSNVVNLRKNLERYAIENKGVYPVDNAAFLALFITLATADPDYYPNGGPVCPADTPLAYVYVGDADGGSIAYHSH